jgi:hypothetical protein
MVKIKKLEKAKDGKHKWIAHFDTGKKTKFGAYGMDDFTITNDEEQRERYRKRHQKDLKTNDPTRAGYLSYYVLWNLPTIKESVEDFNKRFGE